MLEAVSGQAHNLEVGGSIPSTATNFTMNHQNREIDLLKNKFFVNTKTSEISYFNDLTSARLNESIYYNPSYFPQLDIYDMRKGSVFADCVIPTEAYTYNSNGVVIDKPTPCVTIDAYKNILYNQIEQEIVKIFDNHEHVVLSYSGGIDSMVLLSYIVSLGFLHKTTLATHTNKITKSVMPQHKQMALDEVLSMAAEQGAKVVRHDITEEGLLETINKCDYPHVRAYTSSSLIQKYENTAFMFGHHGNQALLHKDIFLDQILLQAPDTKDTLVSKLKGNFYSDGLKSYDVNKTLMNLNDHKLLIRLWPDMDGFRNNRMYAPLGINLNLCRYINYSKVECDEILDAKVARYMIYRNVGTKFDKFISTEGLTDGDIYAKIYFRKDDVDTNVLSIPLNLNHDPKGLVWLQSCLEKDLIEYNTLISIKMIQYLAKILESAKY